MSEPRTDNPAGRLYVFMASMKSVQPNGQTPLWNRVGECLGMQQQILSTVMAGLGDLMRLPDEIRTTVEATPGISDTFTEFLPEVERWLSNILGTLMQNGISPPSDVMLASMKLCSEQLSIHAAEPYIDVEQLTGIRSELQSLLDDVMATTLEPELRMFLADGIHEMLLACDRYSIIGIDAIRQAVRVVVGDVGLHIQSGKVPDTDNESSRSLARRFFTLLDRMAVASNLLVAGTELTTFAMQMLPVGHPH